MFDADCYEEELLHCLPEFEGIPVSFHGPYYETEHSAAPGTPEYAHSMDLIRKPCLTVCAFEASIWSFITTTSR